MHTLELFELAESLLFGVFRHLDLEDLVAVLLDLFVKLVALAEFALNRFELLPKKILSLRPIDIRPGLRVDLLLNGQNIDLLAEQVVDTPQPSDWLRRCRVRSVRPRP